MQTSCSQPSADHSADLLPAAPVEPDAVCGDTRGHGNVEAEQSESTGCCECAMGVCVIGFVILQWGVSAPCECERTMGVYVCAISMCYCAECVGRARSRTSSIGTKRAHRIVRAMEVCVQ